MFLEIACFHPRSAEIAIGKSVSRIELCADASVGGITPSITDFRNVYAFRNEVQEIGNSRTRIHVMIRPRGGDFIYTDAEFEKMKEDIKIFLEADIDGFVFGILTSQGQIDQARNAELVALAAAKTCTFHRAFDEIKDKDTALNVVVSCGFDAILTSGGKTDVVAGKETLKWLTEKANGRIEIMPGGGLRSGNLNDMIDYVGARWWHSSAVVEGGVADEDEVTRLQAIIDTETRARAI